MWNQVVYQQEFTTQNLVLLTTPISIGINEDSRLFGEVGYIGNVVAPGDEEDEDNKDGEMEEHTGWYSNPNLYELKDQLDTDRKSTRLNSSHWE